MYGLIFDTNLHVFSFNSYEICPGTSVIGGLQICEHLRYMPESNGGDHEKFF